MSSECLAPQDLIRFLNDTGAPDTICSLFLRFPVTSAFLRYNALEYFGELAKVLLIDFLLMWTLFRNWGLESVLREDLKINLLLHPFVFFMLPVFYARFRVSIGLALMLTAFFYFLIKWIYFRSALQLSKRFAWSYPLLSLLFCWYASALFSF